MRRRTAVFVDSGAWIALALTRDPLHAPARTLWDSLVADGVRLFTSIPVITETFTFLERNIGRNVALAWKDSLYSLQALEMLICDPDDLEHSWDYFARSDLHKLSAVDATSFAIMKRENIRTAFTFDHHFAVAGFRLVG